MALSRQQAFQQLREPCVGLSSVALKFRAKQAPIKDVLHGLDAVRKVLATLSEKDALDEKLAEYAFFPLTHIFNEAQRLSSSCLEVAVNCVVILAAKGWRHHLSPDMGKQLLILMTLVASPDPKRQMDSHSEELKEASLVCISTVVLQLTGRKDSQHLFDDVGSRSIADQLVYMLLEAITENESDRVQLAAADALLHLLSAISNRVLLASLLPRTASSLTQVLKTSSKARRTRKVLTLYLEVLRTIMLSVLADQVVYPLEEPSPNQSPGVSSNVLDHSWLQATVAQIKLVMIQVTKLQDHESPDVRQAVADLCLMVIQNCAKSLSESVPVAVESLLSISQSKGGDMVMSSLETLANSNVEVSDIIRRKFYSCCQALPRVVQSNDERPKLRLIGQLGSSISILNSLSPLGSDALQQLAKSLLASFGPITTATTQAKMLEEQSNAVTLTTAVSTSETSDFQHLVWNQPHEKNISAEAQQLLRVCASNKLSNQLARVCIDGIEQASSREQVVAIWLALACLRIESAADNDFSSMIIIEADENELHYSRPGLISELYATTLPFLLGETDVGDEDGEKLKALAIECTVLQAQQLEVSYRPELMDTLYPILSLLGSRQQLLSNHSMVAVNLLAQACGYLSSSDMVIDNVDYLINSVALKLNSFDISPQAPQVVLMMLQLCGARIVPFLDDLIGSIFSALDSFHGYPRLVELLFRVLKSVVNQSSVQPNLMITNGFTKSSHERASVLCSSIESILDDLRKRASRKRKRDDDDNEPQNAPHRPWKSEMDKGSIHEFEDKIRDLEKEPEDEAAPPQVEDAKKTLSKSHQLLLDIAKSTSPHLSSPSPQVRHLLLELIEEVAPLLAQDENTFLPMINAVWPSVAARMLSLSDDPEDAEASYNVCAAANTISVMCKEAGSFMSTRIEETFPKIRRLFDQVQNTRKAKLPSASNGALDIRPPPFDTALSPSASRSSRSQVLAAILKLLTTIITYVRVTDDVGDEIMKMLAPFALRQESGEIRRVLETYNSDALWLLERNAERGTTQASAVVLP